jgi:hypothetical protein
MVDDPEAAPRSWVRDEAERIAFEQVLGGLAGRRINAVRYVELGYEEVPCEPFRTGPQFDWVDDALELDLDDGATWTIVWEHDTNVARPDGTVVENNGIIVHPGRLDWLQASEHTAVWDVTEHAFTKPAVPPEIPEVAAAVRSAGSAVTSAWGRLSCARCRGRTSADRR